MQYFYCCWFLEVQQINLEFIFDVELIRKSFKISKWHGFLFSGSILVYAFLLFEMY